MGRETMSVWLVWLAGAAAVAVVMLATWVVSTRRRDVSLVDRVWGLAFIVAAVVYAALGDGAPHRTALVLTVVVVWGMRLSLYLTWRSWGQGEDRRYRALRQRAGAGFASRSLVSVFGVQTVAVAVISLPVAAALSRAGPGWHPLDVVGAVVAGIGIVYETVADAQLSRFLRDPANRGRVMDQGLWRYSRHPNYFGEVLVWWGLLLPALATGAWRAVLGPALLTVLILRVSGVSLTDRMMADPRHKRAGYDDYVRRTNAFLPGPIRR